MLSERLWRKALRLAQTLTRLLYVESRNPCEHTSCADGHWCLYGTCYPPNCHSDANCPPGTSTETHGHGSVRISRRSLLIHCVSGSGYTCNSHNHCIASPDCYSDANCGVNQRCDNGICIDTHCRDDHQCGSYQYCSNGECHNYCYKQDQCPSFKWCDTTSHKCQAKLDNGDRCDENFGTYRKRAGIHSELIA